jgi:hypothetical protein
MHGRDGAASFIRQQDRDAIGRFHRDYASRRVLHQGIALTEDAFTPIGGNTRRRMNLFQGRQLRELGRDVGHPGAEAVDQPR